MYRVVGDKLSFICFSVYRAVGDKSGAWSLAVVYLYTVVQNGLLRVDPALNHSLSQEHRSEWGVSIYKSYSDLNDTVVQPRDTSFMGRIFPCLPVAHVPCVKSQISEGQKWCSDVLSGADSSLQTYST